MSANETKDRVLFDLDAASGVATLTFNRPEMLNAIDVPLARSLLAATRRLEQADGVRCLLLKGAGRAFAAGGDLGAFAADFEQAESVLDALLDALNPALEILRRQDAPIVAAVQGAASGAGFSLALTADLVVAEPKARFALAYPRIGASPDCGGTWLMARKLGRARAMEIALLGEILSAEEAQRAGIVNRIVPAPDLDEAALTLAREIATGPTRAFGALRRLMDAAFDQPYAQHLEAERAAFAELTKTQDFREGVGAFLDKRAPAFKGR